VGRKTTWKETFISSVDSLRWLQSYADSNKGAWKDYTIEIDKGNGFLLTNLPWSELRAWFSFAFIPIPKDWLTSDEYPYPDDL
jgi:hypothetical protein